MNRLEIRQLFVKQSGHYELVVDAAVGDWSDNGANHYLAIAQKWLDTLCPPPVQRREMEQIILPGEKEWALSGTRAIEHAFIIDDNGGITRLKERTREQMLEMYAPTDISEIDASRPIYISRMIGGGVYVLPEPDAAYLLRIIGTVYNPAFATDADVTWWSGEHPHMLVRAARMHLEQDLHRNTTGKNDFKDELIAEVDMIAAGLTYERVSVTHDKAVMNG